jgi:hypothetical protein
MFARQIANAAIATIVTIAAAYDRHLPLILPLAGWTAIDSVATAVENPTPGARRDSVLMHHALVIACCLSVFFDASTHDPEGKVPRRVCFFESSTILVCLHNAFPSKSIETARNIVFVVARTSVSLAVLVGVAFETHLKTRHVAPQVGLVALSLAWAAGATPVGRNASIVCYYVPLVTALFKARSAGHAAFTVAGATASYLYYEKNVTFYDRVVITGHATYTGLSLLSGENATTVVVALVFAASLHGLLLNEHASGTINNAIVPSLLVPMGYFDGNLSLDVVIAIAVMAGYVATGGPKKRTYGHRVMWHCASTCAIAECILSLGGRGRVGRDRT